MAKPNLWKVLFVYVLYVLYDKTKDIVYVIPWNNFKHHNKCCENSYYLVE